MISNHLSMIDQLRPASNELSAQIAQYLAMGGEIHTPTSRPLPQKPTEERRQPPNFQRPAVKSETEHQVSRIRELAQTLCRGEICKQEGISLGVLKGLAKRYNIEFQVRAKITGAPNKATHELEALLVIQVKECIAKGINRQQCCLSVGISSSLLYRLIDDYSIDYPKMKPAFR